ncbi:MAG: hypothetical protein N2C14_16585, partial [Planctomycetales bacterium]
MTGLHLHPSRSSPRFSHNRFQAAPIFPAVVRVGSARNRDGGWVCWESLLTHRIPHRGRRMANDPLEKLVSSEPTETLQPV